MRNFKYKFYKTFFYPKRDLDDEFEQLQEIRARSQHLDDLQMSGLKQIADAGSAEAQYLLACCYESLDDCTRRMIRDMELVEQYQRAAFKYFERSAQLGLIKALLRLGKCYQFAIGVKENKLKALECFVEVAKHHDKMGFMNERFYFILIDLYYEISVEEKISEDIHNYVSTKLTAKSNNKNNQKIGIKADSYGFFWPKKPDNVVLETVKKQDSDMNSNYDHAENRAAQPPLSDNNKRIFEYDYGPGL